MISVALGPSSGGGGSGGNSKGGDRKSDAHTDVFISRKKAAPLSANAWSPLYFYLILVAIITVTKCLIATSTPSFLYRSTDFDVHRNWLAVTRHCPKEDWYYNDVNGTTVHTLDYPPTFAYLEQLISSNPLTSWLIRKQILDERCLALLGDNDNSPSDACVIFQRFTVVLSDIVLYIGAWFASQSVNGPMNVHVGKQPSDGKTGQKTLLTASLIVLNPGLILLDHVHFQYNGMLLGILLISLGCIIRGEGSECTSNGASDSSNKCKWDILAAFFYALLLGMKHLYLVLAPLYFVYLLRHHCFVPQVAVDDHHHYHNNPRLSFSTRRFFFLAVVTGATLVLPYVPIVLSTEPGKRIDQMRQILIRLFPFQRGLCHDYWAANVWALYLFLEKGAQFAVRQITGSGAPAFPDVPPLACAALLLLSLTPSSVYVWSAATTMILSKDDNNSSSDRSRTRYFFVQAIVFASFSGFMLAYHVHEKAIMTAIISLTLSVTTSKSQCHLFFRASTLGHFGLLPLLFRREELFLKSSICAGHMVFLAWAFECPSFQSDKELTMNQISVWERLFLIVLLMVYIFMEVIHPIFLSSTDNFEFLPLLMTSVSCAVGLVFCWGHSLVLMSKRTRDLTLWPELMRRKGEVQQ